MKLDARTRKNVNNALYRLTANRYFPAIPLDSIAEAIQPLAFQEEFLLCGEIGHATFPIVNRAAETLKKIADLSISADSYIVSHPDEFVIDNSVLVLDWYRMPSGKWEINTYLS